MEQPMSVFVDTFGTNSISEDEILEIINRNFDLTPKGKELLKLIEKEINKTDLMEVIEYELNYREQAHKAELQKIINEKNNELTAKNNEINEKNNEINEKNKENARLKAKLKENGIPY